MSESERMRKSERRGGKNNSSVACYRELLNSKKLDEGKLFITFLKGATYVWKRELFTYGSHDFTQRFQTMAIYRESCYFWRFYQADEENLGVLSPSIHGPSYSELNRITSV